MMDLVALSRMLNGNTENPQNILQNASIVSIDTVLNGFATDTTYTVILQAGNAQISGVRSIAAYPHRVGSTVWVLRNYGEVLIIGSINPERGPCCTVRPTANTTAANGTNTPMIFGAADLDPWGMWAVGSPTIITIPVAGWYHFEGLQLTFTANATGLRAGLIFNGATAVGFQRNMTANAASANVLGVSATAFCLPGDQITFQANQNSGGNLSVGAYGFVTTWVSH